MGEAGEMLRDPQDRTWPSPDWWVHVTDDDGMTVCRLIASGTAYGQDP